MSLWHRGVQPVPAARRGARRGRPGLRIEELLEVETRTGAECATWTADSEQSVAAANTLGRAGVSPRAKVREEIGPSCTCGRDAHCHRSNPDKDQAGRCDSEKILCCGLEQEGSQGPR